jgi:hypothetical protein
MHLEQLKCSSYSKFIVIVTAHSEGNEILVLELIGLVLLLEGVYGSGADRRRRPRRGVAGILGFHVDSPGVRGGFLAELVVVFVPAIAEC